MTVALNAEFLASMVSCRVRAIRQCLAPRVSSGPRYGRHEGGALPLFSQERVPQNLLAWLVSVLALHTLNLL